MEKEFLSAIALATADATPSSHLGTRFAPKNPRAIRQLRPADKDKGLEKSFSLFLRHSDSRDGQSQQSRWKDYVLLPRFGNTPPGLLLLSAAISKGYRYGILE